MSLQAAGAVGVLCVGLGLTGAATLLAPLARAAGGDDTEGTVEEIVVTGSNIPRAVSDGIVPVIVFDAAELAASGITTLADFARYLPQNSETMNEAAAGSGSTRGTAQFNLRGAGLDATLTLLNGRRIAPYGAGLYGTDYFVDLNAIPVHAIERIEVLKDGASAIYGAEAVAGVHLDAGDLGTPKATAKRPTSAGAAVSAKRTCRGCRLARSTSWSRRSA